MIISSKYSFCKCENKQTNKQTNKQKKQRETRDEFSLITGNLHPCIFPYTVRKTESPEQETSGLLA